MKITFYKNRALLLLVSASCSIQGIAQQALNLDFEKTSIEGMARPWGWDLTTDSETKIILDSVVKHHGVYSLKMDATSNSGTQVLAFTLESYELVNKTVTLSGWIRASKLNGSASFSITYGNSNDTALTEKKSNPVIGSTGWVLLKVETKIPAKATSINITIQHEGTGSVWFDNFSITVKGRRKETLEVRPSFTNQQVKWLDHNSYKLTGMDASPPGISSDDDDLAFLKSIVGDARLMGLGESTHGTSEFFRLKHRVLAYCVYNLGIRVFAIEDHQLVVRRVNNYVLGGNGTARTSMYGMLGVWQTKEVHDLIEWIREYNDLHPADKVEFTGFDIQNYSLPIDSLYSFISKQSPGATRPVKELLDHLYKNGMNSYMVSDSVKLAWFNNSKKALAMVSESSHEWLSRATNRQDSLSIYWGIQYATLVKQFAENTYRGHSSLYRDIAMAENVSWIINVYKPGAKALLWAHDVHISKSEHPERELNIYFGKSMGAHLSKKYSPGYRSFGLFTYQGEYSCYISYSNFKVTDCALYVSPKGTLDEALHRVTLNKRTRGVFLDLSKARSLRWLTQPIPVRFANHVNIEYGYSTQYSIPYQFDGVFFIDKTTSAKSYAR